MLAYFWLRVLHISAMTVWIGSLFFLPRVFIARARRREGTDLAHLARTGRTLYVGVMTPAGLLTIGFGLLLIGFDPVGGWLAVKIVLVAMLAALHVYYGHLLFRLTQDRLPHGVWTLRLLHWLPLPLVLGIAALSAAKPQLLSGLS